MPAIILIVIWFCCKTVGVTRFLRFLKLNRGLLKKEPNDPTWRQKWWLCQQVWVKFKSASCSPSPVLLLYNIQRPVLKGCLWDFSVNVILLQTSLWKCHPGTLFISSPALFSIIHRFPLEESHTQGQVLFKLHILKCDCETEKTNVLDVLALECYGLMSFAQPCSPVNEDPPLFPMLHCWTSVQPVNHVC